MIYAFIFYRRLLDRLSFLFLQLMGSLSQCKLNPNATRKYEITKSKLLRGLTIFKKAFIYTLHFCRKIPYGCADVKLEQQVIFIVTVELKKCSSDIMRRLHSQHSFEYVRKFLITIPPFSY